MEMEKIIVQIEEIKSRVEELNKKVLLIEYKKTISICKQNGGQEEIVKFDENKIIEDYLFKEKEIIFYLNKYLDCFVAVIQKIFPINKNTYLFINTDELTFYFDSLITFVSRIIESEQRIQLGVYFDEKKINSFYPNRNNVGLWWQIYMLRNRILHFDSNRYLNDVKHSACFYTFSSKCNNIYIDENCNIKMNTTLLDIYKDEHIKNIIIYSINNRCNPFDLLFPNKSAKGKEKKYPYIKFISQDIWFDYVFSGLNLLNDIICFINNINECFNDYYDKK